MVLKAALENDDVFDSDLFQRALLKSYITDESILHLENICSDGICQAPFKETTNAR